MPIFTNKKYKCYSTSKYTGEEGQIWFVRVVPPPFEINDQYIAITTPYVILETSQRDWENYFERVLPKMAIHPPVLAYNELLKYGDSAEINSPLFAEISSPFHSHDFAQTA